MIARIDGMLSFLWLMLMVVGVIFVAGVSSDGVSSWPTSISIRHLVYVVLSLIAFVVVLTIPLDLVFRYHKLALLGAVLLCVLVLVPNIGLKEGGSRRWIDLGFISLQASEWVRLLVVVYVAGYLASNRDKLATRFSVPLRLLIWIALLAFLVLLEPDYGTVVILGTTVIGMLFLAGARIQHLAIVGAFGIALIGGLAFTASYRLQRLMSFIDPWQDAYSTGYQLTHSLIGIGRGELLGVGLGASIQKHDFLPAAHNDFILAIIAEETGFVGVVVVLALIVMLVLKCLRVGKEARESGNHFGSNIAYGTGLLIGIQSFIHIGVNLGVLPTKGLTLPFVSYGGNSLLVCAMLLAMVCRAKSEVPAKVEMKDV